MAACADGTIPDISVVIVSLNEPLLRATVENLRATLPVSSEIIVVDDGSTDASTDSLPSGGPVRLVRTKDLGVSKARNLGARVSRGRNLVFADAHVTAERGGWSPLLELLADPSVGAASATITDMVRSECAGIGLRLTGPDLAVEWICPEGTAPREVPLLAGCFWAMRRDVFERIGGFDEGMIRWGCEDTELSIRLWLMGYRVLSAPQVEVRHLFREEIPYPLEWSWIQHNKLRLSFLHFSDDRRRRVLGALRTAEGFDAGMALLAQGDVSARRAEFGARRIHPDQWFFEKFAPDW